MSRRGLEDKERMPPKRKSVLCYCEWSFDYLPAASAFLLTGRGPLPRSRGVSESVIGLTLVAPEVLPLPELPPAAAGFKEESGNRFVKYVIGSNLFNGASLSLGTVSPLHGEYK